MKREIGYQVIGVGGVIILNTHIEGFCEEGLHGCNAARSGPIRIEALDIWSCSDVGLSGRRAFHYHENIRNGTTGPIPVRAIQIHVRDLCPDWVDAPLALGIHDALPTGITNRIGATLHAGGSRNSAGCIRWIGHASRTHAAACAIVFVTCVHCRGGALLLLVADEFFATLTASDATATTPRLCVTELAYTTHAAARAYLR